MNERIRELMKQSMVEYQFDMRFSPEKFAELIVEECMTMCDTVSADYLKHRKGAFDFQDKNIYAEGEAACDIIKYKMKKHFGVKES
jgi:Fe-S cluster biosynthesis and repair protein YggX